MFLLDVICYYYIFCPHDRKEKRIKFSDEIEEVLEDEEVGSDDSTVEPGGENDDGSHGDSRGDVGLYGADGCGVGWSDTGESGMGD